MSPRIAVEEQQEIRKAELVRATFQEVSEKGFSDTTLEHIAQRAGVSKGVLLYYFRSKEDLFLSAFKHSILMLRDRLRQAVASAPDPVEKVRAIVRTGFVSAKANRKFYQAYLDLLSMGTRQEAFKQLNSRFYENCLSMDAEIIAEGVRQGVFRPDADPGVLRAIVDGLMMQWLFDENRSFDDYQQRCEVALLRYLQG
jgi:AcrR family transcriptional regulator